MHLEPHGAAFFSARSWYPPLKRASRFTNTIEFEEDVSKASFSSLLFFLPSPLKLLSATNIATNFASLANIASAFRIQPTDTSISDSLEEPELELKLEEEGEEGYIKSNVSALVNLNNRETTLAAVSLDVA